MKLLTSKVFWGLLLVLGGVILLFESIGLLEGSELFWIVICATAGLLFLTALITNRNAWWAAIPGVSLLAVAIGLGVSTFTNAPEQIVGSVLLGGIGLSFLIVYLLQRANWWAIIPGGVLITLAIVAGIEEIGTGPASGAIFFAGLGSTFVLVALLPNKAGRMFWAWIPAGILLFFSLLVLVDIGNIFSYIWPAVVIFLGGFFIWRALRRS